MTGPADVTSMPPLRQALTVSSNYMAITSIEKEKIDDLDELFHLINENFSYWPAYIYRGHAQSSWKLESTLSRALKNIKYSDKEDLVKDHFYNFCLEIRGRRGSNPKNLSENEVWALGQHYGLHTPLLDWTQSPYVALFFALASKEKSPSGLRTLWALHSTDVQLMSEWYKTNKPTENKWQIELINPTLDENSRLVNQNSLFTKIDIENDIETWVKKGPNFDWVTLYRIDVSEKIRDKALAILDLMNINYSTLFPDLLGSSSHTNIKLEQVDFILKQQGK